LPPDISPPQKKNPWAFPREEFPTTPSNMRNSRHNFWSF